MTRPSARVRVRVMAAIVPRWEWRVFGEDLEPAESRLAALAPDRVRESDEVYLLAPGSDASVKVRDGRIDVKHLRSVNDDGLEQWIPVLKASFPLGPADVGFVLETLGATGSRTPSGARTVEELAASSPDIVAVPTQKRRAHYSIGGCMTELTEIRADGVSTHTLVVEDPDPQRVSAAVRELGMGDGTVTCVARGLKALTGFGTHRSAVIDVGTNSVKFTVGERGTDGVWRPVVDRAEVTRLGEGLEAAGLLQPAAIRRTVDAIAGMAEEARQAGADSIAAVGTAGLRIAPNAAELVAAALDRCGVRVEVISAEEETRLAYRSARSTVDAPSTGAVAVF